MANVLNSQLMCDEHVDDVALAFCQNHKRLLCFSCALEKAKSSECSIIEIRIYKEEHTLFLNYLSLEQKVTNKKRLIDAQEERMEQIKNDLGQSVSTMYEKLTTRLGDMKDGCFEAIDKHYKRVIISNVLSKRRVQTWQTTVNECMKKLSVESSVDELTELENKFKELETEIMNDNLDMESIPEVSFQPNDRLKDLIMQPDTTLGLIAFDIPNHYDEITDEHFSAVGKQENDDSEQEKSKLGEMTQSSQSEKSIQETSTKGQVGKRRAGILETFFRFTKNKADENAKTKSATKETKANVITESDSTSEPAENRYKDITFKTKTKVEAKYFINKTVQISGLKEKGFTLPLQFSKIVYLGNGYIGLLSEIHSSLVFVGLNGEFLGKKTFKKGNMFIAGMGKEEIALISESGLQITKFAVNNTGITVTASVIASEEISPITGFDFDATTSNFAVSSPEKVIILDKNGKTKKVTTYNKERKPTTNKITTVFDFKNENIYVLNANEKTLNKLSVKKSTAIWKRRLDSSVAAPNCMCLSEDQLCITCHTSIAILSASTGDAIAKHETEDLLEDCLGLCVIDSVIVFSSGSGDFETSTKLAYISM